MESEDKQIVAIVRMLNVLQAPRRPEGKSASSQNAVKHGLLVKIPRVTLEESQADWDEHCQQLQRCLTPTGCLETVLVEKVALQLWRLKRLALYEREVTAISLESVKESHLKAEGDIDEGSPAYETSTPIAAARQAVKRLEIELGFVVGLDSRGDSEAMDSGLAAQLIEAIAEDLDVDIYDDNDIEFPGLCRRGSPRQRQMDEGIPKNVPRYYLPTWRQQS